MVSKPPEDVAHVSNFDSACPAWVTLLEFRAFPENLMKTFLSWLWRSPLTHIPIRWVVSQLPPGLVLKVSVLTGAALEEDLNLIPCLCSSDRLAVDVGAHFGMYTYHLARYAKWVYAFEPLPHYAKSLVRSFPRQVTVEAVALSDQSGRRVLRFPADHPTMATMEAANELPYAANSGPLRQVEVTVKTLDDYGLSGVGFIKIDVEGHELEVLHGAQQTIEREHPSLLVELVEHQRPNVVQNVTSFLKGFGYSGFYLLQGVLNRIEDFDPAVLQREDQLATYRDRRQFVVNFLFLRPEHMGRVAAFMPAPAMADQAAQRTGVA